MRAAMFLAGFLVVLKACTWTSDTSLPTRQPTAQQAVVNHPTPMIIPTPTPAYLRPEIVKLCPAPVERLVPLNTLGLDANTFLILLPSAVEGPGEPGTGGIWLQHSQDESPRYVALGEATDHAYRLSLDHRWISFRRKQEGEGDVLWVSSLDGERQWKVLTDLRDLDSASWASGNEIVVFGLRGDTYEAIKKDFGWRAFSNAVEPLFSIDPFTKERKEFLPLPATEVGIDREISYYFRWQSRPFVILWMNKDDEFILQDLSDGSSQPAFQWLRGKPGIDVTTTDIEWLEDSTFVVTVARPYGIDLAYDLDLEAIRVLRDYETVMQKIDLPEEMRPASVVTTSRPAPKFLLLEKTIRFEEYYPPIEDSFRILYLFDYRNMVIRDYCFNFSKGWEVHISPDGRFLASTFYEQPETFSGDKWVVVMNLETGYLSYISGFQFIGWGVDDKQ